MVTTDRESINQFIRAVADSRVSRRELMKRASALGLTVPAAGAILGWQTYGVNAQTPVGQPAGKLVISMSVEPDTLENWKAYSTDGHPILRNVQEALLNRDPATNELVGELATAWEQTDDRTWRFTLRQGVTFHNGDPFNAEVAAFGINYTWSPENEFEIYQFIGPDMTATAVDEFTVDVQTVEPDPILPARLYFSPIPNMIQVQERPDSLVTEPIGTGPYSFVEWNRGQYIRITANPNWWGLGAPDEARGVVTIQDCEFVFRAESAVRAAQVVAGEAQIGRFLAPEDCETTPNCLSVPSVETIFLRLDTNHVAMKDIRIRQAIAFAVDKQAIADELFGGGEPASKLVGPSATGYNADLEPYPYDLDRAKALVEEAAADGVPVDAELVVVTREGIYLRNDELAEYVAGQLREIGLNCRSEVIEPALYNPEYSKNIKDVPEDRGWITTNPHGNEIMDVSATASSYYRCDGAASTYCDPALDEALNAAIPLVGEERGPALAAVTKMYYDAYASVPVIYMPLNYGLAAELQWAPRLDAFMLLKEMTLTA
jgi:peptide/nickel transport system substrate-binding protein